MSFHVLITMKQPASLCAATHASEKRGSGFFILHSRPSFYDLLRHVIA
jgi:hypothetical protein